MTMKNMLVRLAAMVRRPTLTDAMVAAALRQEMKIEVRDVAAGLFSRWGSICKKNQAAERYDDLSWWKKTLISNALTENGFRSDDEMGQKVYVAWVEVEFLNELLAGKVKTVWFGRTSDSRRSSFVN